MDFSNEMIDKITEIFDLAYSKGRNVLYEYEVYDVLNIIGLETPQYQYFKSAAEVNEKILKDFENKAVLKVVSSQIAHKQKVGGVKIIHEIKPDAIKKMINSMDQEIFKHYSGEEKPVIEGYLLVQYIAFNQSLGNEVLFGLKHDEKFGPMLTLSKGGDDAEFFAKYYDPANLIVPPLSEEQALEVVRTLNIRHKFESMGHTEYIDYLARAALLLSFLSFTFSPISGKQVKYIIKEMDINPFVISEDQRFMAVDGYATIEVQDQLMPFMPPIKTDNLNKFFKPKGIAVVGVSQDASKKSIAREIASHLHGLGRKDIYLINKKGGSIIIDDTKYTLYKDINEISDQIDLVIYAAPARYMIDFIKELKPGHNINLILISGIPTTYDYLEFENKLDEVIPSDTRIIGPNCMGVFYGADDEDRGLNTLFINEKKLEVKSSQRSNTALITQSGALAVTLLDHLGSSQIFKSVVSFGNKYDVNVNDLLTYFSDEEAIDVLAVYIEGFERGEGRRFFEIAQKMKKPIIVYKSGKTEAGALAAASHTASMSGSYEVFKAACKQAGVVLAEKIEDHLDYLKIFSLLAHKKPNGNKIAGVFNAGFETTISADELDHLEQAVLSENTIEKLKKADKLGLVSGNTSFLDITPGADDKMYADFAEALLQDENVDCVLVAVVPHADDIKSDPEHCNDADSLANLLNQLAQKYNKPLVISVNGGRYFQAFTSVMERARLPVYGDVRSAIKSLDRLVTYYADK